MGWCPNKVCQSKSMWPLLPNSYSTSKDLISKNHTTLEKTCQNFFLKIYIYIYIFYLFFFYFFFPWYPIGNYKIKINKYDNELTKRVPPNIFIKNKIKLRQLFYTLLLTSVQWLLVGNGSRTRHGGGSHIFNSIFSQLLNYKDRGIVKAKKLTLNSFIRTSLTFI